MAQQRDSCRFYIEGRVYDLQSKEPLPFANILVAGTDIGTVSDERGGFLLEGLCSPELDLLVSYLGYKSVRHHHDAHHDFSEIYLAPEGYLLEGVVIEGKSTAVELSTTSTARLDGEELRTVASESLGDVASQIAGVSTLRTGQNIVKPVIHGLHSNRILLINNGLRHAFQNWGEEHAPEIDPSLISDLEVIKGAGTVRYGPEALGGVILVRPPRMDLSTPLRGSVGLTGKTNGRSGDADVELRKGFERFSLLGGASIVKQGDLQAANYNLSNTGKEEISYYGGFRLHPTSWLDLEGYYSHFDQELGILSGSVFSNLDDLRRAIDSEVPLYTEDFTYTIDPPRQEAAHDLYKATLRYTGKEQALSLQFGHQVNRRREFGVRRSDAPNIDLELVTSSLDLDWSHPGIGPLRGKIGMQWQIQSNDNLPGTNTVPFIPNYDSESFGAYIIESIEKERDLFELGIRYDYMTAEITGREPNNTIYRNTIYYGNFTGTVGWVRRIGENDSFRSNFATAWRPPNVAELYRFGQHSFFLEYGLWRYTIDEDTDFISTNDILTQDDRPVPPEVGYKWINTYSLQREGLQAELTGYVNFIQNYIYAKPAGLTRTPRGYFVYFIYDQADALLWGLDLSAEWQHHPTLRSRLMGSFLSSYQVNPRDYFAGQPPPMVAYHLTYEPSIRGIDRAAISIEGRYTFEQFQHPRIISVEEFLYAGENGIDRFREDASDFDILPPPPAYFLLNLRASVHWKHLTFQLQLLNALNQSYRNYTDRLRYFADDLGRNLVLGVSYDF